MDADFACGISQEDSHNTENVMSYMGYVITYIWCILLWYSKLQTEVYLSTIEAEYIALRQAMRNIITFMALMKEISYIIDIHLPNPEVFCNVFEDNQSCIAVAESNTFFQEQKIASKYHHSLRFVQNKIIQICYIDTREQASDIFTKPFDKTLFIYL